MDLRIFTEPQQGATYDTLLRVAKTAEDLGFDAFFRSDHYLDFERRRPPGSDRRLADARCTRARRLASASARLVSPVTFRWPGQLAIEVAQVDTMSSGRVELGLGAGWNDAEHSGERDPVSGHRDEVRDARGPARHRLGMWSTPDR